MIRPRQDAATTDNQAKLAFLYGMRGMGKTTLTQKLAENISPQFDQVVWIDLAAAPPLRTVLAIIVKELDGGRQAKLSQNLAPVIAKTIGYLQQQRCLLILDHADPIFNAIGLGSIDIAPAYIQFLDKLNAAEHQSFCLIIASVAPIQIDASYHKLELQGLDLKSCQSLVKNSELVRILDRLISQYLIEVKNDCFMLPELVMEYMTEYYQDLIPESISAKKLE